MGGFGQLHGSGTSPALLPYLAAYLQQADIPLNVVEAGAEKWTVAQTLAQMNSLDIKLADSLCLVRTSVPTIDCELDFYQDLRNECQPVVL